MNAVETCTDIPECMMATDIRYAMQVDNHLDTLTVYMINPGHQPELKLKKIYNQIVVPTSLQQRALQHFSIDQMGIEKDEITSK